MKGIILAAGEGSRLRPLTDDRPKCLVELGGKPLLDWQIDAFRTCGVHDIIVVKGYLEQVVQRPDVRFYINGLYQTTNMVFSLFCAREEFDDDVIISYADIVYDPGVLAALIEDTHDLSVIVDEDWESYWRQRFDDPLKDAESLKMDERGGIVDIGQRPGSISEIEAQYVGLMKFTRRGLRVLKESYDKAAVAGRGAGAWGQSRPVEKAYMTDLLQGLIAEGNFLHAVRISGGWLEIDSLKDLELAAGFIKEGTIIRRPE